MTNKEREWFRYGCFVGATVMMVVIIGTLIASVTSAQEVPRDWNWTEPAAYHDAIVKVQQGSAAGTGTLIYNSNGRGVVLTAAHVIESGQTASAEWRSGHKSSGRIISTDKQADCALFECQPKPDAVAIPIMNRSIEFPVSTEFCGYGGPTQELWHWSGTLVRSDHRDNYSDDQTGCLSGDSGGPILYHAEGKGPAIVGLIEGSPAAYNVGLRDKYGHAWNMHAPVRATRWGHLERMVTAAFNAQSQWGTPQGPVSGPRMSPSTPSVPTPSVPITQPCSPIQKPDPPVINIDYEKIAVIVIEKMAGDERFKPVPGLPGGQGIPGVGEVGPKGPQGEPGNNGQDAVVDYDELTQIVLERLPPIYLGGEGLVREVYLGEELPPMYFFKDNQQTGEQSEEQVHLGEGYVFRLHPHPSN